MTDTECGAGAVISVKTSVFLDDLYWVEVATWRSNLVQMLHLCMITESDVTEKMVTRETVQYVLLWESTRGQGRKHRVNVSRTSTQRYVLTYGQPQ